MTITRSKEAIALACLALLAVLTLAPAANAQVEQQFQASAYTIGDRLRVQVYEETQGGFGGQALFPRADLGGDFIVDEAGQIALPRIGRFSIAGLDYERAREQLIVSLQELNPALSEVHFELAEREPVYVVGLVREPGSFRYAPGMLAIQAIALAGGYERPADRVARLVDGRRERERLEQAIERRVRLVARRDALLASRDGVQPSPSSLILSLTSAPEASRLLADEADRVAIATMTSETRIEEALANARTARTELAALQNSTSDIDARISELDALAQSIRQPDMRLANQSLVVATRQELASLAQRKIVMTTAALEAQRRLTEAEAAQSNFRLQRDALIAETLIKTEEELEQLEGTVTNASIAADALDASISSLSQGSTPLISVVRRTLDGPTTLTASDLTQLAPGDVVNIRAQPSVSQ
ncbi:MAG: polysaccharide biosynthesis/export family protein [Pseudomonadota bacterium]